MIKCQLCNVEFKDVRIFNYHVSRMHTFENNVVKFEYICHSIYGKDKTDELILQYKEGSKSSSCLKTEGFNTVNLLIYSLGIKRSHSDEKRTIRYKTKYENSCIEKYGVKNVSQIDSIKKKKEQTYINHFGSYDLKHEQLKNGSIKFWNEYGDEHKIKLKKVFKDKYGVENPMQVPEFKQKAMEKLKSPQYESKLEIRVQHALVDLGYNFTKHIYLEGNNYDLLVNNKIIIEIQGDYWHCNPKVYNKDFVTKSGQNAKTIWSIDTMKREKALANGFMFVEIWESEMIDLNDEELKELIKEKLNA